MERSGTSNIRASLDGAPSGGLSPLSLGAPDTHDVNGLRVAKTDQADSVALGARLRDPTTPLPLRKEPCGSPLRPLGLAATYNR